jgi:hypothetical protein
MEISSNFLDISRHHLLGQAFTSVYFLPPHSWVWTTGKKTPVSLLLDFTNDNPRYQFDLKPLPKSILPTTHGLSEMISQLTIIEIESNEHQQLSIKFQRKQDLNLIHLTIQLAPYLPRFTISQQGEILFDSILGWRPKKPIHFKTSLWIKDDSLTFSGMIYRSLQWQYQNILTQVINKKNHRQVALESDLKKHQLFLAYQQLADQIKVQPNLTWEQYKNPENLPLPIRTHQPDYKAMNLFYHYYKKAKTGIQQTTLQLNENQQEITALIQLRTKLENPEISDIEMVETSLSNRHLISGIKPKPEIVKSDSPYWIKPETIRFSFGKNAKQNHYLTFSIAKKHEIFLHIKGKPGSHVIIHHREFDHDLIIQGAQLVLALAKLSSAEVTYAKVGSLKATKTIGQVIIKDAKNIKVNANPTLIDPWLLLAKRY